MTAAKKVTWLTPYWDLWCEVAGQPSPGPLARYLKPVHDTIGTDRTAAALGRWLRAGNAKYGPHVFARVYREWDQVDPRVGLSKQEQVAVDALTAFRGDHDD